MLGLLQGGEAAALIMEPTPIAQAGMQKLWFQPNPAYVKKHSRGEIAALDQ